MLGTILKVGQLLALFDGDHPEWRVSDAAQKLGIAKSSAHDLMSSLTHIGLLTQTEEGRYRLGWKLMELSEILQETSELRTVARPIMEQLGRQYQETLHLAILDRCKVVYLDKIEGRQMIRVEISGLGTHLYPHCTGVGKVMMAHLPSAQVEDVIRQNGLPRFTDNTITQADTLRMELEVIRRRGFGYDMGEVVSDLRCVAAPIYNYRRKAIAALSMSVPVYRFERSETEFRTAIVRAAHTISHYMGFADVALAR